MKKDLSPVERLSSTRLTRRSMMGALIAGTVLPTRALAQGWGQAPAQPIAAPQAEWGDRFDATSRTVEMPRSVYPTLSPSTLATTEQAVFQYGQVTDQGGWPMLPGDVALKIGMQHPNVGFLRQRLVASGDLPGQIGMSDTFDSYVEAAVRRAQKRHGLIPDGQVGRSTIDQLNVPAAMRLRQLETNVVRLRSLANQGPKFVMVNIPAAEIEAVEADMVVSRHTAVVGKPDRASPVLSSRIHELNFNPFWTVPASIIRKDLIPKMQEDPEYLTRNRIRIFNGAGTELPPASVDWNSMEATNYMFRQDPGEINSLGSVRINFHNPYSVYMHDTPQKNLFGTDQRFHSSGCVRVQNVRQFVTWLAKETPGWDQAAIDGQIRSGEQKSVGLSQPVPLHWVYITAWATADGAVQFRDDIYTKDGIGNIALSTEAEARMQ